MLAYLNLTHYVTLLTREVKTLARSILTIKSHSVNSLSQNVSMFNLSHYVTLSTIIITKI